MKIIVAITMLSVLYFSPAYPLRATIQTKTKKEIKPLKVGTEPSYLRLNNKSGAFYAWTRSKYYFSASAKGGVADLDAFMKSFPY